MPTDMTPDEVRTFLGGDDKSTPIKRQPPDEVRRMMMGDSALMQDPIPDAHTASQRASQPFTVGESSAIDRAKQRGWSVYPELTPGNPHGLNACKCKQARLGEDDEKATCTCTCHGRTYVRYKRGA